MGKKINPGDLSYESTIVHGMHMRTNTTFGADVAYSG